MLGLIKKVKRHGIFGSLNIFGQKLSLISKKIEIRLGKYNFYTNEHLLTAMSEKLFSYQTDLKLNKNIDFNFSDSKYDESNKYFLLGESYTFTNKINWNFNSSDINKSYPEIFSGKLNILDYKAFGDYKITWELNRHHHFVWLAQKYYLTRNEFYKNQLVEQINSWILQNKPGYGINFVSPMEISIRLINWFISVIILYNSGENEIIKDKSFINSFLGQSLYLRNNLFIKRKFRNNHSIVELSSLILIQSVIKWNKLPSLENLFNSLFSELKQQFYSDGINFEHSPTYSRFTIESLLIVLIFVNERGIQQQKEKLFSLTKIYCQSLRKFVTPLNSVPQFSDCDYGRILFLSGDNKDFNDFRGFFDFCALYFNNNDLFVSSDITEYNEETKWWCTLANASIKSPGNKNKTKEIIYFADGGYYIYKNNTDFLVFKSGYPGNKNLDSEYAPHIHNDLLSLELFLNAEPIFVDSGTFTYNLSHNGYRAYFRSIYAHNTIIINNEDQLEYLGAFGAKNLPQVNITKTDNMNVTGVIKLKNNSRITRRISIGTDKIKFIDSANNFPPGSKFEINLNFHPAVIIDDIDNKNKTVEITTGKNRYLLKLISTNKNLCTINNEKGWVSGFYNCKDRNEKVNFSFSDVNDSIEVSWSIEKF